MNSESPPGLRITLPMKTPLQVVFSRCLIDHPEFVFDR
jgi:hypothetical protein